MTWQCHALLRAVCRPWEMRGGAREPAPSGFLLTCGARQARSNGMLSACGVPRRRLLGWVRGAMEVEGRDGQTGAAPTWPVARQVERKGRRELWENACRQVEWRCSCSCVCMLDGNLHLDGWARAPSFGPWHSRNPRCDMGFAKCVARIINGDVRGVPMAPGTWGAWERHGATARQLP